MVLLGTTTFIGWASADSVDDIMDSFEQRLGLPSEARTSRDMQARIRIDVAERLRLPDAETRFTDVLAAACLWLALRHWSGSGEMRTGLAKQMADAGMAVVTASIADPAPEGAMADTAWSFMVGGRTHDGRDRLRGLGPETVEIIRS